MLIETKSVRTLNREAIQRIIKNADSLLLQSIDGLVMFEGHYYHLSEVKSLIQSMAKPEKLFG